MNVLSIIAAAALAAAAPSAQAQGAAYQCGGVGQGDQERIKAEAATHDALLTFAESSGAYLADVDVRILDSRGGEVLSVRCEGPLMLLDLPAPGRYRVIATLDGEQRERPLVIGKGKGKGPARAVFVWSARGQR